MSAKTTTEKLFDLNAAAKLPTLSRVLVTAAARYAIWHRNHGTRKRLARLSASELDDIGISQTEARNEARRPFFSI